MFEVSPKRFSEAIIESVKATRISVMDSYITGFSTFCFKDEVAKDFPANVFTTILDQMKSTEFQALLDSHKLLFLFESEWGRLNETQKSTLLEVISNTFTFFKDELACFILSEIIGEYFANHNALKVLDELSQTGNETLRAYITHGYRKLGLTTKDGTLKRLVIDRLSILKNDISELVKQEAIIGLNRLEV
jgi:hypothetical protein